MATGMREKTTNVGGVIKRIWYAMTGATQGAELASLDEAGNFQAVDYNKSGKSIINYHNIAFYGADNTGLADCATAFEAAKLKAGTDGAVYFPKGTFLFTTSRYDLSGVNIVTHPEAVIKIDENPNTKNNNFLNPVTINNPVHATVYEKSANTKIQIPEMLNIASHMNSMSLNEKSFTGDYSDSITWLHKVYQTSTGDISSLNGTGTVTTSQITWASNFTTNPQVVYPASFTKNVLYEQNIAASATAAGNYTGGFAKTAANFYKVLLNVANANLTIIKTNLTGETVYSVTRTLPNGLAYSLSAGQEVNFGFMVNDSDKGIFFINGLPVFETTEAVVNIGFMLSNVGDNTQITFKDLMATSSYKPKCKKHIKLGVVGDSISYGAWSSNAIEDILPKMIAGHEGIGSSEVINHAISGSTSSNWATTYIATIDCSDYDRTLVMLGTNDVQGSQTVTNYIANMTTIANKIISDGSIPIIGIFPIFTNATNSGVTGVTTQNYEKHAKYTHALKKWCIQNGYEFADIRRNFGADLTIYGDNVHPKLEGQIAFCAGFAEAIKKSYTKNIAYFKI